MKIVIKESTINFVSRREPVVKGTYTISVGTGLRPDTGYIAFAEVNITDADKSHLFVKVANATGVYDAGSIVFYKDVDGNTPTAVKRLTVGDDYYECDVRGCSGFRFFNNSENTLACTLLATFAT